MRLKKKAESERDGGRGREREGVASKRKIISKHGGEKKANAQDSRRLSHDRSIDKTKKRRRVVSPG